METESPGASLEQACRPESGAVAALIARLEQADRPTRKLDAEIAVVLRIGPKPNPSAGDTSWVHRNFPEWVALDNGRVAVSHSDGRTGVNWAPEPFTSSVDAARTLTPEDWRWDELTRDVSDDDGRGEVSYGVAYNRYDAMGYLVGTECAWGSHDNLAIALCIAALRATALNQVGTPSSETLSR